MIEKEIIGLLGLLFFFILIFLRIPIAFAMIVTGIIGNYFISIVSPYLKFMPYILQFKTLLWNSVANYDLAVIPLFIFMGYIVSNTSISKDLFTGIKAIVGRISGGTAIASIFACAGFGSICGSSLATASTMGKIAIPELEKQKYSKKLATGTLAAGGTLGILVPPSIGLVIYAVIVEASIIQMFQAAIIPAFIAIIFFIFVILILSKIDSSSVGEKVLMSKKEKYYAILNLIPILFIFGSIITGLSIGLFSPTPAAAVGVLIITIYSLILRLFNKGLSKNIFFKSIYDTASTSGMIYFIVFSSEVMKSFFTRSGIPILFSNWASVSMLDPWLILVCVLFALILLGLIMESLSLILIAVPFIWPILIQLNGGEYIDVASSSFGMNTEQLKIWFGIISLIIIELGLISPPIGMNVLIISKMFDNISSLDIYKGVLPFFIAEVFRIILIVLFPFLVLLLPNILL